MASHRLANIKTREFTIAGYSVAGEETVVAVPELDVCFDIGKAPDQFIPIDNVLLTHGHMDHSAGIAYYLSQRNFCGQKPGTVLAPADLLGPIRTIIDAWGELDGNEVPANLVGVRDGDEYEVKPNVFVRAFATKHSRGAVGYTVLEKRKKLKEEYLGLSSREIVALKKKNVTIDYTVEIPLVSYLGDTAYMEFDRLDHVRRSKVLIAECTFLLGEHRERASAGRHMHIDQFAGLVERMENEVVIVTHLTQRMGIGEAKSILRERMSPEAYRKLRVLMDRKFFEA